MRELERTRVAGEDGRGPAQAGVALLDHAHGFDQHRETEALCSLEGLVARGANERLGRGESGALGVLGERALV
jgi:hypothetical protein